MESNKGMVGMALGSWLVAFAGGTLAGTLAWVLFGWSFLQGAFLGAVVFLVVGVLVSWVMTRPLPRPGEVKINPPTPAAKASATKAAPINVAPAPTAAQVKPTARLAGEEELAARKGDWKYEKEAAPAPAPKKKAAPKKAPAKKAAPKAAAAPDGRPVYLSDAPKGTADDLKKISGVGPKLEQTLNELGVWHFEQVAQFKKKDIAWVDERLRFKGRIERDDWVGQAKALANAKD